MDSKRTTQKEAGFGALGVIAIIVIIGLMVALVWVFLNRTVLQNTKTTPSQTTSSATPNQASTQIQPDAIISKAKAYLASSYSIVEDQGVNNLSDSQVSVNTSKGTPPYKVDGASYYVTYDEGSTLSAGFKPGQDYQATSSDVKFRTAVAQIYSDAGLKLIKDDLTTQYQLHYQGAGLTCTIDNPTSTSSGNGASCGLVVSYTDAYAAIKPLLLNYPNTTANQVFSEPVITDGATSGYKVANSGVGSIDGIGGAGLIFYKKGSGEWQFFTAKQAEPTCDLYNTADLKAAFKGTPCYDNATEKEGTVI